MGKSWLAATCPRQGALISGGRRRAGVGLACLLGAVVACQSGRFTQDGFVQPPLPGRGRGARAADGLRIAYDVRGTGATSLVFVHCWTCDRSFWAAQVKAFEKDYRVVALDLGGHGASGRGRASWSIPQLADDVRAVVDHLGLRRVVLVGHSMGGPVCLEAARRLDGRVIGVVCVETLHDVERQPEEDATAAFARRLEADFAATMSQAVRGLFPRDADPAVVSWVTARALRADPRVTVALLRQFHKMDLVRALSEAKVPVRCLNAASGGPGAETQTEKNRRYADFDAVRLKGVGHFPMLERPAEFNARLREVLAEMVSR